MSASQGSSGPEFRARMPRRYRISLLAIGAAAVAATLLPLAFDDMGLLGIGVAALTATLFLLFARMQTVVRLETEELSIRVAGLFSTSVPYRSVSEASPDADTGFIQGMGLRKLGNRTTGYLVGGPTVRIRTGDSAILVSTESPEELASAIQDRRAPLAS